MSNNFETFLSKDYFYTVDELTEVYPELGLYAKKSLVMKDEKLFNEYKETDLLEINVQGNHALVSKKLITDILSNLGMFRYVTNVAEGLYPQPITINYIYTNDLIDKITLTGPVLIEALKKLDLEELNEQQQIRKAYIESRFTYISLYYKYRNKTFMYFNDGGVNKINTNLIIELLDMSEEEFNNIENNPTYLGYTRETLSNVFTMFMNQEDILNKYWFTDKIRDRINNLVNNSNVKVERPLLKQEEASDIPEILEKYSDKNYSVLEQMMHYYISLSKTINDGDVDYYLMFFYELITKLNQYSNIDDDYSVSFSVGEYDILIHSNDDLNDNNLPLLKLGEYAIHFDCVSENEVTKAKFNELFNKVYKQIISKIEEEKRFNDSLAKFNELYHPKSINRKTKLYLLIKQLTRKSSVGLNIVDYNNRIFERIFGDDQGVKMSFLIDTDDQTLNITPITVISVKDGEDYAYFVINPKEDKAIVSITKEELEELIKVNNYQYIDKDIIPGMVKEEGTSYVRGNKKQV